MSLAQKALLLEQTSVFTSAPGEALFDLAGVAEEVPLDESTTLCGRADAPSIYILLSAGLTVELPDSDTPVTAGRGDLLGVAPTLTGRPMGVSARVTRPGIALRIQQEDFFQVLGDHLELLHGVSAVVLPDYRRGSKGDRPPQSLQPAPMS